MIDRRIHRTTSNDGTRIAGHVDGQGPPLVLVHGALEDGDLCWDAMVPHLRHRFTCYRPSTRSRGLSDASDDLTPQRRLADIVSFVDSIGEPVLLFGESDGGALALGAAARSDAVAAVGVYEPVVFEVAGEDLDASLQGTLPDMARTVADGRLAEAARIFGGLVANDGELAALTDSDYLQEAGRYMPVFLRELEQADHPEALSLTDASLLDAIEVPVLLQRGTRSALYDWMVDGTRHVAAHVADARVQEIEGAGHFAVALEPEAVADRLGRSSTWCQSRPECGREHAMGYVQQPDESERLVWALDSLVNARATTDGTQGRFELLEYTAREGDAAPVHAHANESESFYVLQGQVTMLVGEDEVQTTAGSFTFIPPGERHAFRVDSPTAKFLQFMTSGGILPFFEEIGEPATSATLPRSSDEPWDIDASCRRWRSTGCRSSAHPSVAGEGRSPRRCGTRSGLRHLP